MKGYRRVWYAAATVTVGVALVGTLLTVPIASLVGLGMLLATFGGAMGLTYKPELPEIRHPVLLGAGLFTLPALYPGLTHLVGVAALALVAVLVATSPWVWPRLVQWMRGRVLPTEDESAVLASPHDALRRQWEESTRQLARAPTVHDQLLLVMLREEILEDMISDGDGALPDYVWVGTSDRGGPETSTRGG